MQRYETLILARTQVTADELSMIENFFESLATKAKGKVSAFDKWGKYRLAFPVKKNDYGIYVLVRYEIPEESASTAFKDIQEFFQIKCNEFVMRYVTIKLHKSAPVTYKYPESIDGLKSNGLDSFLKENKMESLLDNVSQDSDSSSDISMEAADDSAQ